MHSVQCVGHNCSIVSKLEKYKLTPYFHPLIAYINLHFQLFWNCTLEQENDTLSIIESQQGVLPQ